MPIVPADSAYADEIRKLLQNGKHIYSIQPSIDPNRLISQQISVMGVTQGDLWGFLSMDGDEAQATGQGSHSASKIPQRIYLTHVGLAKRRSPYEDVPKLLSNAVVQLWRRLASSQNQRTSTSVEATENVGAESGPHTVGQEDQATKQLLWYGDQRWLVAPLERAGLTITERIEFFVLDRLQKRTLPLLDEPARNTTLRLAQQQDLTQLAQIDAGAFSSIWHVTGKQLQELWTTHRIFLLERDGTVAGYSAIAIVDEQGNKRAHLARLAIDQRFRNLRLGRHLLLDVLHHAQRSGVSAITLNTQTDNLPARELYRSVGFSRTGTILPVMTKHIKPNYGAAGATYPQI